MKNYFRHLSVICIIAVFVTMMAAGCGSTSSETTAESANSVEAIELTEESSGSDITTLMNTYFTALKKGDVSALSEIMVNAPSEDTVKREIEYVEDYWNIQCYSAEGIEENTWVTYVYYDVKFNNIDTAAPSMIREYICTNSDGRLYINNGTVDSEVAEWLDEVQNSETVSELLYNVNSELTDAASEDDDLATLVEALGVEESEAAESTEAAESSEEETTQAVESAEAETTEAQATEAVESTAAETTKAEESAAAETTKSSTEYKAFSKTKTMYTTDLVNVRKKASKSSKILGRLDEGKKVTALGTKNGFTAIKYGKKTGYIKTSLLTKNKPKTTVSFKSRSDKVEALMNVKLRKKPSTSAKSGGTLPGGTVVKRTGYNKKWTRIKYKGKTYYVATKYVKKTS